MSSRNKRYSCKWGWLRNFAMILKLDCSMQSRVLRCSLEFSKKFSGRQLCSVSFCQLRYLQTLFKPCTSATHSIPVSFGRCSSAVKGTSWLRRFAKVLIPQSDKQITTNDLKKFLTENSIRFEEGYTCLVIDCQLCHRHGHRYGNPGKLFINRTTGMFLCLKCQSCGSWQDLQDYLSLLKMGEKKLPAFKKLPEWLPSEDEIESLQSMYNTAKSLSDFDSEELQEIFQNFAIQNLSPSILEKYDVRIKTGLSQLLFPIYAVDGKMVGLQVMNAEKVSAMESVPRNLIGVLFGWKQLNAFKHSDTVVIAGSPFDVLAIAQEVNVPVVSLPQEKYLPLEVLPLFEPYHKVIFWLGNNMASWELAKMLARKLNDRRCFIIRPQEDHPTPLEALRLKLDISKILKTAHAIAHKAITTFHTLRQDVFSEICHTEQVAGVKWKRYPLLTRLLKGHRHGELTVFTGPTGSGKTTFMSEYSLDLCMQGIRTLWGSFEIRNSRLAKMMLTQFALISLDKHLDQYDYWADKFEQLPLYFMTFHGSQSIRSVLDAMRHAVYVHDIEHVIVDNLQFMMGTSETSSPSYAFDRFWRQDIIVSSFRQFATVHNCHVTLVIHPRKENSDELNNMSIFGGAKASQEADNVLILQDRRLSSLRGRKYIQVTKNRYDGELGICPLDFDRETFSYALKKKPRKSSKLNIPIAPETTSESDDSKPVGS